MFKKFYFQVFKAQFENLYFERNGNAVFISEKQGYEQIMLWNHTSEYRYFVTAVEDFDGYDEVSSKGYAV